MTTQIQIKAKTLKSKKAFAEVQSVLPAATYKKTMFVAGLGYVAYILNENKETIAHLIQERCGLILSVK